MAAGVTAKSVLDEMTEHLLECSICSTSCEDPETLDCSHSFCQKCFRQVRKQNTNKIKCPLNCQQETTLPEGGATKLTNSHVMLSVTEEVVKEEQFLQTEGSKVTCQACNKESEVISQCTDCEHYVCQECKTAHTCLANSKNHNVAASAESQLGRPTSEMESEKNVSRCEIHCNQELCLYCNTCEQLICKLCTASSHQGPMHDFVDFETASASCLQSACELAIKVDKCDAFKDTKISTNWVSLRNRLSIMLAETKEQISQKAEMEVAKIRQKETQLLQKAQATFRKKDKKLAELTFAKQTMERVQTEMTENNNLEILKLKQSLLHDYKDVYEKHTENVTCDLSFISFKENDSGLGTLLLEEKWELLNELMVTGRSIASLSTREVVIVATDDRQQPKVTKLTSHGKVLSTRGIDHVQNPERIATNKDDHLFVLDGPAVKTFNKEYQLLHQFTPGKESNNTPTCLAVDDSGLIAVGYQDKGEISLHNPDGTLIRTLPAPMIERRLIINNMRLIYASNSQKKLMCIDYMGNHMFTVDVNDELRPYNMCCDKAGDIYVLSHRENDQIDHYSAEGKHIASAINDIVGCSYYAITYTPDGKIALTGDKSTRIYHRV